jgi:hypothetical protein
MPIIDALVESHHEGELTQDEDQVHVYRTAEQGGRDTGGRLTRADLTVLVHRRLDNLGEWLDIHAIEVKPYWSVGRDGLYEAAAQAAMQRCSHSWLVAYVPGEHVFLTPEARQKAASARDLLEGTLRREAQDLGLGVALVSSLRNGATAEAVCSPRRQVLDPVRVDELLGHL